ncbi:dna-directed rna polymerase ii subunit rpb1, partial [Trichoderma arundinaceum]
FIPLSLLLLLYRLSPHHPPLSTTTTKLFILYTLASQLIIRRISPLSLLRSLILPVLAHVLIAAIYILHYLANAARSAQKALFRIYVQVSQYIELSIEGLAAQLSHPEPPCLEDDFSETSSSCCSCSSNVSGDKIAGSPPWDEIVQVLEDMASPAIAILCKTFSRLQRFERLIMLYMYSLTLSRLYTFTSLYNQAAWSLYITRVRFALLVRRFLEPFFRASSYLVGLGNLYSPIIAVFALHFILLAVLLSIGQVYALLACLLSIFWVLSWLNQVPCK